MPPLPVPPPTAPVRLPLLPPPHTVLPAEGPWPPENPLSSVGIPAFPLPSDEEYRPLGIEAYQLNMAPDVDNTSDRAQHVFNTRSVAIAKQLGSLTDEQFAEMEADFHIWARGVQPSQSPHTTDIQLRCRMTWSAMISKFRPKWPFSCHWDVDVVIKFGPIFLPFLVRAIFFYLTSIDAHIGQDHPSSTRAHGHQSTHARWICVSLPAPYRYPHPLSLYWKAKGTPRPFRDAIRRHVS